MSLYQLFFPYQFQSKFIYILNAKKSSFKCSTLFFVLSTRHYQMQKWQSHYTKDDSGTKNKSNSVLLFPYLSDKIKKNIITFKYTVSSLMLCGLLTMYLKLSCCILLLGIHCPAFQDSELQTSRF